MPNSTRMLTMEGEVSKSHHHSSILAIAGPDFCIVAADTRQSSGYLINCRTAPKAYKLTNSAVLATSGFHADGAEFYRVLATKIKVYSISPLLFLARCTATSTNETWTLP